MRREMILYTMVLLLALMSSQAFAISLKLDFYGGNTTYTKGTFEDEISLSNAQNVMVDVWLVDWASTKSVGSMDWELQVFTPAIIEVTSKACNNLKPTGKWDNCSFGKSVANETVVIQAEFTKGISDSNIQLATFSLHRKAQGIALIKVIGKAISDTDGYTAYAVDSAQGTIK